MKMPTLADAIQLLVQQKERVTIIQPKSFRTRRGWCPRCGANEIVVHCSLSLLTGELVVMAKCDLDKYVGVYECVDCGWMFGEPER